MRTESKAWSFQNKKYAQKVNWICWKIEKNPKKMNMHDASAILHTKHSTRSIFLVQDVLQKYWPALRNTNAISLWRATASRRSRSLRLQGQASSACRCEKLSVTHSHATIPGTNERNGWYRPYKSSPNGSRSLLGLYNVGKTITNHPFGNGLYHLFMVIWGIVYDCFTMFYPHYTGLYEIWNLINGHGSKAGTPVIPCHSHEKSLASRCSIPNIWYARYWQIPKWTSQRKGKWPFAVFDRRVFAVWSTFILEGLFHWIILNQSTWFLGKFKIV